MLRRQLRFRIPVIVLIPLLLLVAAGIGLLQLSSTRRAIPEVNPPTLELLWVMTAGEVASVELSGNGRRVAIVRPGGTVDCYDSTGRRVYRARVEDADTVELSDDGESALVYTHLDPLGERLTFLDGDGRVHWQMEVDGAVWSSDALTTDEGARYVVGTGERYIYVIDVGKDRRHYRRWRAPGVVTSAAFDSTGKCVLFGSWQKSEIGCATVAGRTLWCRSARPERLSFVHSSLWTDRLLLESVPINSGRQAEFSVLDAQGQRIWRGGDREAGGQVLCAPNGRYVCVGYTRRIEHQGRWMLEKHARLLDASGRRVWDKGSMFFSAQPLAVTTKGCAVICNQNNALFAVGSKGVMEASHKLTAQTRITAASVDGSRLLVYCADQRLSLFSISD